jgi:hypothetical protein
MNEGEPEGPVEETAGKIITALVVIGAVMIGTYSIAKW